MDLTHGLIYNGVICPCCSSALTVIFANCSADEDIDSKFPTNIVVYSNGVCSWVPLGLYISSCSINIKWFPFDDQECTMKFGSWTYDGSKVNLTNRNEEIDTSNYQPSGEWDLICEPFP